MRRLLTVAAVVALNAAALAQTPQIRLTQADPIVRLLSDLESALLSGRPEDLTRLATPALRAEDRTRFARAIEGGNVTTATLRERARRPIENGYWEVLAEVFVSHDRRGRRGAVFCLTNDFNVRFAAQPHAQPLTGERLVVHHQCLDQPRHCLAGASTRYGIRTDAVAPRSVDDRTTLWRLP